MAATLRHQASVNSTASGPGLSPTSSVSSQTTTPTSPHFLHAHGAVPRYASTHPYGSYPHEARSTTSLSITHPRPSTPPLLQPPPNVPFPAYLRSWGPSEIASFLGMYRCGQYAAVFQKNDIDGKVLPDLDMQTLKEMGIAKVGERVKLYGGIKDLRKRLAGSMAAPVPVPRIELRLNGASTPDTGHPQSPDLRQQASMPAMVAPSSQGRRLNTSRPPPLDLQPHHPTRALPMAYQNHPTSASTLPHPPTHSQSLSQSLTPRPRIQHSSSSNATVTMSNSVPAPARSNSTLRAPPSREGVRRSPSPVNGDASSFVDRPLPPAPSAQQSSAAEYANAMMQRRQIAEGRATPNDQRPVAAARPVQQVSAAIKGEHRKQSSLGATPRKEVSPVKNKFAQLVGGRPNTSGGAVHPFAATSTRERSSDSREDSSTPTPTSLAGPLSTGSSHRRQQTGGYVVGSSGMMTSKSSSSETRSRKDTASQSQTQLPLEDIRRQVVKFINIEDGTTRTVNVSACSSGVDVLEKVLKKFGKWNTGTSVSTDGESDEDGDTLQVDGWGVYTEPNPGPDSKPLSEASLLGICLSHRDGSAIREQGLVLKRKSKQQYRKNMEVFFGETPPPPMSPTSPTYRGGPRLGFQVSATGEDPALLSPSKAGRNSKKMNRASTVSIMSGLGVPMPDIPPSPSTSRSPSTSSFLGIKKKPFYNFLGHRPPSELIANHLGEYFPAAKRKELEKSRNSMLRMSSGPKRLSMAPSEKRGSFDTDRTDRRSITSPPRRKSMRPTSTRGVSSPPPAAIPEEGEIETLEPVPRMSVSTDGGQISRPKIDGESDRESVTSTGSRPPLLPPFEPSKETLSDTLGAYSPQPQLQPTPKPRPKSILQARRGSASSNKSRMSMLSQLRKNRDRSDTASMLTVDEITAEVEHRRASTITFDESSDEEAMAVPPMVDHGLVPQSQSEEGSEADEEDLSSEEESETESEEDDEEEEEEEESEEDEQGKAFTSTGSRIFKWIKGALIGAGSFGSVYLGMDAQSGLLMAVKQVELPTSARNEERKKSMVDALEREIELLKELQHDNIVQYLDSSSDGNHLNIFLEYVPGGSVAALLNNYGAFEEPLVKNFCRQILTGLNYLHEREIIHRDIKGANILVDNKGGIKISDFGISKKVESNLMTGMRTNRPSLQGSVFWMAPEVVKQTSYSPKADIWSVGCLVVEMLTGTHPWAELTQMQAIFRIGTSAKPATPSDIAPETANFLEMTFEIDHTARPTANELLVHPFIAVKAGGPGISAQQAKHAMAAANKSREQMMGGMQSLSALAEVK